MPARRISAAFSALKEGEFPRFQLVLLGLGEDGHTASVFPGTSVLNEKRLIVSEVHVETLAVSRVTLTIPAINNAATVMFLVSGRTKAAILRDVLEERNLRYPAQLVKPHQATLLARGYRSSITTQQAKTT